MVQKLWAYFASGTTTKLVLALYADAGGHPGQRLARGEVMNPSQGTWVSATVPATPVTHDQTYWIALLGPLDSGGNFAMPYLYLCDIWRTEHSQETDLDDLPMTWTPGQTFAPSKNSFYATE